jgi:hypothetical protein
VIGCTVVNYIPIHRGATPNRHFVLQHPLAVAYPGRMDWKHVATLPEKEQMRAWVENWKRLGPELERARAFRASSVLKIFDQHLD